MNFRTNMTSATALSQPLLTRNEILEVARKLAHDRNWSVKLALAVVQCRLDAERRYREADLAYSLLDEEVTRGATETVEAQIMEVLPDEKHSNNSSNK